MSSNNLVGDGPQLGGPSEGRFKRMRARVASDPRIARVIKGSFTALLGRGLAVMVNLVTLPLILRYLGKLEFGIWVTISTSVVMFSVLDLGIANTLTNLIAEAHAQDDRSRAMHSFATAFWVTIGLAGVMVPAFYAVWNHIDWGDLFHLTDPVLVLHAKLCVGVAAGFFLCSLPLSLAGKVLGGYQQLHLANYFTMSTSVLSLVAILATVEFHGSIVALMAAYSGAMLAGTLALNIWLCGWNRPWIAPRLSNIRTNLAGRLFGNGFLFFVIQSTGLVVFSSDNLVITHYLGAAQVTPYSFAWRLSGYAGLMQSVMLPSLWPAFGEAYHKRELDWIRTTYRSVTRTTLKTVGVAVVLIGLFGRPVIRLWAGPDAVPQAELIWLMGAFNLIMAATTNQAFLLNAAGRMRLEAIVAVLAALANLSLSIWLVQRIGPPGVILATIVSFLVLMIVPQEIEVRRVLAGRFLPRLAEEAAPNAV